MIWKRLCLLNAVFLAGLLLAVTVGTLVALARSQDDQPALPRLNPRLDIMHHDKWPAQLPGPTGIDRIRSTQPTFAPDRVLVKYSTTVWGCLQPCVRWAAPETENGEWRMEDGERKMGGKMEKREKGKKGNTAKVAMSDSWPRPGAVLTCSECSRTASEGPNWAALPFGLRDTQGR